MTILPHWDVCPPAYLVCCPGGSQRKGGADVSDQFARVDHLRDSYGVLIQIKQLINGSRNVQSPIDEVVYYHVDLPREV